MAVETREQIHEVYGPLLGDAYDRLLPLVDLEVPAQDIVDILADFGVTVANSVAHEVLGQMGLALEGDYFGRGDGPEEGKEDVDEAS
jgi:hypothetical protein